jgi:hypothetical protein
MESRNSEDLKKEKEQRRRARQERGKKADGACGAFEEEVFGVAGAGPGAPQMGRGAEVCNASAAGGEVLSE